MQKMHVNQMRARLTVRPVRPSDFRGMAFTPSVLLKAPAPFVSSLVGDEEYQGGCEAGFDAYFEKMYRGGVFLNRIYTPAEVERFVHLEMVYAGERNETPLSWRVGFLHGWLSALALTDRSLALQGVLWVHWFYEAEVIEIMRGGKQS